MCFLRNRSSYSFETCTVAGDKPENFGVCWVWPSKYEEKWCFSPKCVFSETDHHKALKLVPLQLAQLKTSGLNSKKSDVLAQNVFSEMDHHTALKLVQLQLAHLKTLGCAEFGPSKYEGKWCFSPKCVFSVKQILIQLWNLYSCSWQAWKSLGCAEFGSSKYPRKSDVLA